MADSTTNPGMITYSVDVESTLGGEHRDTRLVLTRDSSAACGVILQTGVRYLLFPNTRSSDARQFGGPTLGLCSARWQINREPEFIGAVLAVTAVEATSWAQFKATACSDTPAFR